MAPEDLGSSDIVDDKEEIDALAVAFRPMAVNAVFIVNMRDDGDPIERGPGPRSEVRSSTVTASALSGKGAIASEHDRPRAQ